MNVVTPSEKFYLFAYCINNGKILNLTIKLRTLHYTLHLKHKNFTSAVIISEMRQLQYCM